MKRYEMIGHNPGTNLVLSDFDQRSKVQNRFCEYSVQNCRRP